jgi:2-polyprenyl-6-methoxyphenol hydroxylase-like FAD-dependent oxidoreductase
MPNTLTTTCCIIGGGPAGIMLGFLLARSGVEVTVLEKHADFFRDFRGDTIHPSTLQLLHELGLLDRFLEIPHTRIDHMAVNVGGRTFPVADCTHLPTVCKYVALMPQWDFLNFLAAEAAKLPNFVLHMGWEATGLLHSKSDFDSDDRTRITGVTAQTPNGPAEITANLTVGCDGRHATSVTAANLPVIEEGVPIDVLWFRLPRLATDPESALGFVNFGRLLVLINRMSYYQCAYIIRKGGYPEIQQAGLEALRASVERIAPFLTGRTIEIDSWEKIKLLTVQINHLERWSIPGLLCIGDAAHAMSPVGGIGINIALQDAVAAANLLAEPLRTQTLTDWHLRNLQTYRETAVRRTQRLQALAHKMLNRILQPIGAPAPGPITPPLALRILTRIPGFQYLTARIIGMGLQPEHIHTAAQPDGSQ